VVPLHSRTAIPTVTRVIITLVLLALDVLVESTRTKLGPLRLFANLAPLAGPLQILPAMLWNNATLVPQDTLALVILV
jgi:hypothetical protein